MPVRHAKQVANLSVSKCGVAVGHATERGRCRFGCARVGWVHRVRPIKRFLPWTLGSRSYESKKHQNEVPAHASTLRDGWIHAHAVSTQVVYGEEESGRNRSAHRRTVRELHAAAGIWLLSRKAGAGHCDRNHRCEHLGRAQDRREDQDDERTEIDSHHSVSGGSGDGAVVIPIAGVTKKLPRTKASGATRFMGSSLRR